jgi:8-oxo-dGTP pyrophosphatase MutT (NUDIX family)
VTVVVPAAGGVPWRVHPDAGVQVLLVHRPRYDDWTFPKGKRDGDETDRQCAVREVLEETGLQVVLGRELPTSEYMDAQGRPKVVRYWTMTVTDGAFEANAEVDEVAWLSVPEAAGRLSYRRDQPVLTAFAAAVEDLVG